MPRGDLGKQIVYHTIQDPSDALSAEELSSLDSQIASLREAIALTKAQDRLLRASLNSLNASVSTGELRSNVRLQRSQKDELRGRLDMLKKGKISSVSLKETAEVDNSLSRWETLAKRRKKICLELWAMLTEEVPEGMTKDEIWVCCVDHPKCFPHLSGTELFHD